MTPLEAERCVKAESEASHADSLERRFSEARGNLLEEYQELVRFYGGPDGPLVPRTLVFKLTDLGVRNLVCWVLSDFLGWCCFTSACAAFRERGDVNARFVQALADTVCFGLSGREPAMPRDEDSQAQYVAIRRLRQVHPVSVSVPRDAELGRNRQRPVGSRCRAARAEGSSVGKRSGGGCVAQPS